MKKRLLTFSLLAMLLVPVSIMAVEPQQRRMLAPPFSAGSEKPSDRRSEPEQRTCMIDNPDVEMSFYNSDFLVLDERFFYWQNSKAEPDGLRHKIIREQGNDITTAVPVLPEGENVSIRLGTVMYANNELAKGGGVKFQFTVTQENAIVYANFSALVEDPLKDHLRELEALMGQTIQYDDYSLMLGAYSTLTEYDWTFQQPIITFYIEENGTRRACAERSIFSYWPNAISTQYGATIEQDNYGHPAYYNDWSVMAIDLSPYIGKTISFGAEYHDCAEAGTLYPLIGDSIYYNNSIIYTCDDHHLSRLYLHPSYGPAQIQTIDDDCTTNTVTCSAPEGFREYRWYASDNKSVTLGNSQTLSYTFSPYEEEVELCCELTSRLTIDCYSTVLRTTVKNNCDGCYSPKEMINQRWNDFLSVSKKAYDKYGGFTDYQWYREDQPLAGETGSQLYLPVEGLDGKSGYSVEMTRLKDGVRIRTCPYYPVTEPNTVTLSVTPTVVSSSNDTPIRISVSEPTEARLYYQAGMHVATWHLNEGDNTYRMPSMHGLYLIVVRSESGEEIKQKIIVE